MLDLAKLATEITPGPWEATTTYTEWAVPFIEVNALDPLERIAVVSVLGSEREQANATAFALVPELIAEVLRLQEELETVRGLNDALRANGDELLERCLISEGRLPGGNP